MHDRLPSENPSQTAIVSNKSKLLLRTSSTATVSTVNPFAFSVGAARTGELEDDASAFFSSPTYDLGGTAPGEAVREVAVDSAMVRLGEVKGREGRRRGGRQAREG